MNVGDELRTARTERQLSIEQLSARTRIIIPVLRAIENNDIARLPAAIFTRGFLRAYAAEVGLDPPTTVARFLAQFDSPEAGEPSSRQATDSAFPVASSRRGWTPDVDEGGLRAWLPIAAAALALGLVLYFAADSRERRWAGDQPAEDAFSPAPSADRQPADASAGAPAAVATAGDGIAPAAIGGSALPLHVALRAEGLVWVTAHADGSRVLYRLLQPGESETIDASGEVVVRAGDAGNLTASVNNAPGHPLGAPGQVVTTRFTP